jgi:hypothetical protein
MHPDNFKFGGGVEQTILHPLVLVAMLLVIVLMFSLRRKYLIVPFLLIAFLAPVGQQLVVGGLHIFVLRLVVLAGLIRMFVSKFPSGASRIAGGFDNFDKLFVAWVLLHSTAFILLYLQMGAVINQFGHLWSTLGGFFLLRYLIRDDKDVERAIRVFALIAVVVVAAMLTEHFRHVNVFGLLGGVPLEPELRNGHVRAQGPFKHPLLAGSFGAILLPLFFWLWRSRRFRSTAVVGMVSATLIPLLTATSTSLIAFAAAVGGSCMWALRKHMRVVRWGIAGALVALHLVMKAPVWFLIAHIDLTGGSSSDHRAHLVDLFIRHIGDWWLLGTNANLNWGWDMWDTANQYVEEGYGGGLAAFLCFLGLIAMGFSRVGRARKRAQGNRRQEWYFWLLGAALFANVVAFFGISYHDQTQIVWFALLAMISAATISIRHPKLAQPAISETAPGPIAGAANNWALTASESSEPGALQEDVRPAQPVDATIRSFPVY